ncbi:nuclease-like protein [Rhodopseudomonas thermotolerans]|uniref:Nuclease-like protein n=3 Tax=Nitrobacteraceae TaxID=41294 RepID=A0A336JL33_9BRAD|nr:nuclease-like protein [Rhodopseudomonas pentothenatexigens]REG06774.1 nuclease-like protein [Rhodopseudomonas thermotolerans]SSW89523.1 nuclease-like protein [Rhodopseudomonas pentothenatexigens]
MADSGYSRNMSPYPRTNPVRISRLPWRRRLWPWVFVLGVAAGTMLPARHWLHLPWMKPFESESVDNDSETVWRRAGNPTTRHAVDVLYTIDGDTFDAMVHLWPGAELRTRVRLRGIDAPELKAQCARELRMAEAAAEALRRLLAEGEVAIYNIGPDKYQGRVVADVATRRTANVSSALLDGGYARAYGGAHRYGWCEVR